MFFHESINKKKFKLDKVISFIPPDGQTDLIEYSLPCFTLTPPLKLTLSLTFEGSNNAKIHIAATAQTLVTTTGTHADDSIYPLTLLLPLPSSIASATTTASFGESFNQFCPEKNLSTIKWLLLKPPTKAFLTVNVASAVPIKTLANRNFSAYLDFTCKNRTATGTRIKGATDNLDAAVFKACRHSFSPAHFEFRF